MQTAEDRRRQKGLASFCGGLTACHRCTSLARSIGIHPPMHDALAAGLPRSVSIETVADSSPSFPMVTRTLAVLLQPEPKDRTNTPRVEPVLETANVDVVRCLQQSWISVVMGVGHIRVTSSTARLTKMIWAPGHSRM